MDKIINYHKITEIALNPEFVTGDDFERLKNQGFNVRWINVNELYDKNIYSIITKEKE